MKTKAQKLRRHQCRTGGGPQSTKPLSRAEERLMELIGWTAVEGDKAREVGLVENIVDLDSLLVILFLNYCLLFQYHSETHKKTKTEEDRHFVVFIAVTETTEEYLANSI